MVVPKHFYYHYYYIPKEQNTIELFSSFVKPTPATHSIALELAVAATSEAYNFAIAASFINGRPASDNLAAL
ncbi:hypothetical protein DERP_011296 [Dermatophagoides pteronyssinus]|uniref:Uncharacterized protein n=1 Tax=Dermatophagoides pteronyssinus TaxID=6956 RepID=A0ABQ8J7A9_DERPT|nr:hypothetical protein DERP_011296 [Dermatophagoides pteronyssinus]